VLVVSSRTVLLFAFVVASGSGVYGSGTVVSVRTSCPLPRLFRLAVGALAAAVILGTFASEASAAPTIRFNGNGLDRFKFHGRVPLDPPSMGGPIDPLTAGFGIELLNDFGFVYRASLLPGDLEPRGNLRYQFRDDGALDGNGTRAGLFQVITRFREYAGGWYYTVRVLAFADLSTATEPSMTVIFNEVDGMFALTADWVPTDYGWRLPLTRF
jgi:hypothetical protein